MSDSFLHCAVVSTDADLRQALTSVLGPECGLDFVYTLVEPFTQITPALLDALHAAHPEVVFVDLESNPALGVRFAQTLKNLDPEWKIVAVGPPEPPPNLVLDAMRAGISEYLMKPVTDRSLIAAVERLGRERVRARPPMSAPAKPGELLVFFGVKGGCGSTTVASNLAVELHRLTGKKTVLVDMDFVLGEISLFMKVEPRFDIVDLANNLHRMESGIISSFVATHESGVHLVVSPREPDKARGLPLELVEKAIAFLRKHYDYVVVDGSNSLDTRLLKILEHANQLYLVLNVDLPSLRNARQAMPMVERLVGKDAEKVALIINRYRETDSVPLSEVERVLGAKPFYILGDDGNGLADSINLGKPAVLDPRTETARQLRALGSKILGMEPPRELKRGILSRFLGGPGPA